MSKTFEKILVKDDRIACITSKVKFQVVKGGQNITCQPFKAVSMTPSAHVFNVTVPSLETIISREVLWKSTVTLHIVGTNKPANEFLLNYGVTDALAAFPLHSLVSTMTATINNNTVSMNVQDTLPVLLRLLDDEEINTYDDMTPTTLDYLANYADAVHIYAFRHRCATWPAICRRVYSGRCRSRPRSERGDGCGCARHAADAFRFLSEQRVSIRHEQTGG